jgi:integrase/recombinase XerD
MNLIEDYQYISQNSQSQTLLEHPLLHQDTWHTVNDLNLKVSEHKRYLTLNFSGFKLDWFKRLAKLYILVIAKPNTPVGTIKTRIYNLRKFSDFLTLKSIYKPDQINHLFFEEFDYYLRSKNLKQATLNSYYTSLANFFDICRLKGWIDVNTYWFKGKRSRDYPKNDEINYLPEEVWNQLDKNLHYLPEPLQRMVLVIRSMGIRIGELCNMPFDCLRKRGDQWRIRFVTEKYQTTDELPIAVPELVAVIKEQQEYIRQYLGQDYDKLFCGSIGKPKGIKQEVDEMIFSPKPKVMGVAAFNHWLNRLSSKCRICSKDGIIWHFQSHQFRRTVATVMTNAGVRDLIIQKYLRHRSPNMQHYYKHLLKKVLGSEYEELLRSNRYIDKTGKIVAVHRPKNPIDEFIRQKMNQITTQYGECHRPNLNNPCPTVNACLRCQHWRVSTLDLPHLHDDLKRVEEELKIAESMGMIRQQQGLKEDRDSLINFLQGLDQLL